MRNLSMKKFGTPIGAAPGIASEKVGLSSVGAPSIARPGCAFSWRAFLRAAFSTWLVTFLPLMLAAWNCWLPWFSRARVELSGLDPPWVRLGAPGFSLPSGVGVEVGLGAPGTAG